MGHGIGQGVLGLGPWVLERTGADKGWLVCGESGLVAILCKWLATAAARFCSVLVLGLLSLSMSRQASPCGWEQAPVPIRYRYH